jgi:hypothetical protein
MVLYANFDNPYSPTCRQLQSGALANCIPQLPNTTYHFITVDPRKRLGHPDRRWASILNASTAASVQATRTDLVCFYIPSQVNTPTRAPDGVV